MAFLDTNKPNASSEITETTASGNTLTSENMPTSAGASNTPGGVFSDTTTQKPRSLDPRIKIVWRLSGALPPVIVCLFLAVLVLTIPEISQLPFGSLYLPAIGAIFVVWMAISVGFIPAYHFAQWRFRISHDFCEIQHGIFWRKHTVIPFIRVQNTDTQQGPLLRVFGLSKVTISTASGQSAIPGLDVHEADALRDKAAELARIAREDV